MSQPLFEIGDKITCINGHLIAEVVKPVFTGEVDWMGKFVPRLPSGGTCSICGATFTRRGGIGWQLHVDDGTWK